MISVDDIEKILSIVEKHDFSHFEFEQENSRIFVEKMNSIETITKKEKDITEPLEKLIQKEGKNEEKIYIKSSLAGTFYSRKEKNAEPFVKLHDLIKEDTIIGLVEVMKLFNEIEAGISGEIVDILVEDGEFVEYGQPLFEIKRK